MKSLKKLNDKLTAKVNNIDTSGFVLKSKYDTDKSSLEKKISDAGKKIPNISRLVKKNAKITEIESKIPSINGLATTAALDEAENKLPDVSNLVKTQIMTQKYYTLDPNILLQLISINLQVKHLMQR